MSKKKVSNFIYIDYGSNGNAGYYSKAILDAIDTNFRITAFLHKEHKREYKKIKVYSIFCFFYENIKLIKPLLNVYKTIDLGISFLFIIFYTFVKSLKNKQIIIINLYQSFIHYYFLILVIKKFSKVCLVIHDGNEHNSRSNYPKFLMSNRDKIINASDLLIFHGSETKKILYKFKKTLVEIPFPFEKPKKITKLFLKKDEIIKFLFIGNIREEKGVKNLLKAWEILGEIKQKAQLTIAGNNTIALKIDQSKRNDINFKIGFLSDELFEKLISESHYIVLPYLKGTTNSGIFSVVTSQLKPSITSNIELFKNSIFSIKELRFENSIKSLALLFENTIINHKEKYKSYVDFIIEKHHIQNQNYRKKLLKGFNAIIEKN